jgi:hypothetical protein
VAETSNDITWSTPQIGVPATVKIEYNVGGGWNPLPENYQTANDGIVANSGTQGWSLGTALSNAAKIRVSDPADAASAIESDPFKIRGELVVTAPNGGQSWEIGTNHNITWTKKGAITTAKLQLSTAGDGGPFSALADGDSNDTQNIDVSGAGPFTFDWKIPNVGGITTTNAKIRVVDGNDATVYDSSDDPYTIKGRVELTNPNGGDTLTVATPFTVNGTVGWYFTFGYR